MAVAIGSRYQRGHIIRIDTVAGTFEELNSPGDCAAEYFVQMALLAKPRKTRLVDRCFWILSAIGAVVAISRGYWGW